MNSLFAFIYLTVVGTSMLPGIRPGDHVWPRVDHDTFDDVRWHDTCVYNSPTSKLPICHRAVRRNGDHTWTMGGDNNFGVDPYPMTRQNFVCIVWFTTHAPPPPHP